MKKYNPFIIIFIFMLIYQPPIIRFNVLHIIGCISWIYILLQRKLALKITKILKLEHMYILFAIIWLYLLVIILGNENSILFSASFVFWMIDIIPACIMLNIYFIRKKYSINTFLNLLLIVGLLQSITAIGAFFLPSVKALFVNQLISYGYSDIYSALSKFRIYGMASNLTYTTPVVQSVFAMIAFYLAINKDWNYIFFTPWFIFSALINARTSLVLLALGFLTIIICSKKMKFKTLGRTLLVFVIIGVIFMINMAYLKENAEETYDWIIVGFREISMFLKGDVSSGYFQYVFNAERYLLPNNFGLLFGVGSRVMERTKYVAYSDIGFINDVWLGGILYCVMLYSTFAFFLMNIIKKPIEQMQIYKFFFLFFIEIFIACNIKGYIFDMNNFTTLFFVIYTFLIVKKGNGRINNERKIISNYTCL